MEVRVLDDIESDELALKCLASLRFLCLYFGSQLGPLSSTSSAYTSSVMAYVGNTYYYLNVKVSKDDVYESEISVDHKAHSGCIILESPWQVLVVCSNPDVTWSEGMLEAAPEGWLVHTRYGIIVRD